MNIYYDTEFIDDGYSIELISIGMTSDYGRSYYAVSNSLSTLHRACAHDWLYENVVTKLPIELKYDQLRNATIPLPLPTHPDFPALKSREKIAQDVADFILATPKPQLWADYAAYDHVVMAQLFGPMIDLPSGIPMFTHEFRQYYEHCGMPELPTFTVNGVREEHHALFDALELRYHHHHLAQGAK